MTNFGVWPWRRSSISSVTRTWPSQAADAPMPMVPPTRGRKKLVERLLLCDVVCANAYVAFLMTCASALQVVRVSIVPVGCMFVAAQAKRRRKYNTYVVFHGLWHLGSAWAMYEAFR